MPRLCSANACRRAVQQALDWLELQFGNDDEWAADPYPLVAYHKVPYLLAVTGHVEECRRALAWIKANLFMPDGDFLVAPSQNGTLVLRAHARDKAWVILAAQVSGCFDMARPAAEFLIGQQGAATGGMYDLDAGGHHSESADVRATACAGLVFLACGLLDAARRAGHFVTRAVQLQSDEKRFYTRLDLRGNPIRKFSKADAAAYVIARARGRTRVSYLGIPMVFLAKLHLAAGEREWLEAAMDYFAFAQRYDEAAWTGERSGPLGWGAAMLYGITRRRLYYDAADRVAQAWIRRQKPDGSWSPRGSSPESNAAITRTAEATLCLLESLREAQ